MFFQALHLTNLHCVLRGTNVCLYDAYSRSLLSRDSKIIGTPEYQALF